MRKSNRTILFALLSLVASVTSDSQQHHQHQQHHQDEQQQSENDKTVMEIRNNAGKMQQISGGANEIFSRSLSVPRLLQDGIITEEEIERRLPDDPDCPNIKGVNYKSLKPWCRFSKWITCANPESKLLHFEGCGCACVEKRRQGEKKDRGPHCPSTDEAWYIKFKFEVCKGLTISCKNGRLPFKKEGCGCGCVEPPPDITFSPMPSSSPSSTFSPTPIDSEVPSFTPGTLRVIPTECELELLIEFMDAAIQTDLELAARWIRLAFHDAGTFDQKKGKGGANGCLLTEPTMRDESENMHLDFPINALIVVKQDWEDHDEVCVQASNADLIQFAGFFSSLRQVGEPGLSDAKIFQLKTFLWGRPDEPNCDGAWTHNLPGFELGNDAKGIASRCDLAGVEIEEKMMIKNGFTAEEAVVLIGAHTVGLVRFTFGDFLAGPWVENGADEATDQGPVFDNAYFDFLENDIIAKTSEDFEGDVTPFTTIFPDWFRDDPKGLDHLDTDVVLAFPSQHGTPDFHTFTAAFANDNMLFLTKYFAALDKMSKLGVLATLDSPSLDCDVCPSDVRRSLRRGKNKNRFKNLEPGELMVLNDKDEIVWDDKLKRHRASPPPDGFFKHLNKAKKISNKQSRAKQARRERTGEIKKKTTPVKGPIQDAAADPNDEAAQEALNDLVKRSEAARQANQFLESFSKKDTSILSGGKP